MEWPRKGASRGRVAQIENINQGSHGYENGLREFEENRAFERCCGWSEDRHSRAPGLGQHALDTAPGRAALTRRLARPSLDSQGFGGKPAGLPYQLGQYQDAHTSHLRCVSCLFPAVALGRTAPLQFTGLMDAAVDFTGLDFQTGLFQTEPMTKKL